MFKTYVKNLYIEYLGFKRIYIKNPDPENPLIHYHKTKDIGHYLNTTLVSEILMAFDLDFENPDYTEPDYGIVGNFRPAYKNQGNLSSFEISPLGEHILLVTGIPKGLPQEQSKKFRKGKVIHSYYWEDNSYGYYTQVIPNPYIQNSNL